jgi:hypothetical protein
MLAEKLSSPERSLTKSERTTKITHKQQKSEQFELTLEGLSLNEISSQWYACTGIKVSPPPPTLTFFEDSTSGFASKCIVYKGVSAATVNQSNPFSAPNRNNYREGCW